MTTYNKTSLKTFFQTGDVPTGNDYANLIDSQVNMVETAIQAMAGPLSVTELVTPKVSAAAMTITGLFSPTGGINTTTVSAASAYIDSIIASAMAGTFLSLTGNVSAGTLNVSGDVSAATGTVYASSMRVTTAIYQTVGIVSAAGTAQATATLIAAPVVRGQGVVDGTTTGFRLPANQTGMTQVLINESAVSANLWPPTGGTINALSTNVPFPLAASTPYIIFHKSASAYAVK